MKLKAFHDDLSSINFLLAFLHHKLSFLKNKKKIPFSPQIVKFIIINLGERFVGIKTIIYYRCHNHYHFFCVIYVSGIKKPSCSSSVNDVYDITQIFFYFILHCWWILSAFENLFSLLIKQFFFVFLPQFAAYSRLNMYFNFQNSRKFFFGGLIIFFLEFKFKINRHKFLGTW